MLNLKNVGFVALGALAVYAYHVSSPNIVEKEKFVFVETVYDNIPNPPAVPVPSVYSTMLPEIYPWDSTKKTLLDCDTNRQSERIALACNIYHESRDQSDQGQIAVGLVTRNRVQSKKFPNSYSKVVWQIKRSANTHRRVAQFSWALDGKPDKVRDADAWIKAWNIAGSIISGKLKDFTNGSLWYHTKAVRPSWRNKFHVAMIIEDHIFYKN